MRTRPVGIAPLLEDPTKFQALPVAIVDGLGLNIVCLPGTMLSDRFFRATDATDGASPTSPSCIGTCADESRAA
jgi:hypothetical protein